MSAKPWVWVNSGNDNNIVVGRLKATTITFKDLNTQEQTVMVIMFLLIWLRHMMQT